MDSNIKLLSFKIKNQEFAIELLNVQELVKSQLLSTIANQPSYVLGMFDLRGHVVPTIDLGEKLGMGLLAHDTNKNVIIVFNKNNKFIGALVDETGSVISVPQSDVMFDHPSLQSTTGSIKGIVKTSSGLIPLLNIDEIQ